MLTWGILLAFALASLVIEVTPGPNMAYLAVLSMSNGRRAGFAATLGVATGLLLVGIAAALGLSAMVASSRVLYELLRWAGLLYLLWLAWEGWRGEDEAPAGKAHDIAHDSTFFMRGTRHQSAQPQGGLVLRQHPAHIRRGRAEHRRPGADPFATCVAIATAVHSSIVLLGDAIRPWLQGSRRSVTVPRALSLWSLSQCGCSRPRTMPVSQALTTQPARVVCL